MMNNKYSKSEIKMILRQRVSDLELAEKFGRTVPSIRQKRYLLKKNS